MLPSAARRRVHGLFKWVVQSPMLTHLTVPAAKNPELARPPTEWPDLRQIPHLLLPARKAPEPLGSFTWPPACQRCCALARAEERWLQCPLGSAYAGRRDSPLG